MTLQARETGLAQVFLVEMDLHQDERGAFGRAWCRRELDSLGLSTELAQINVGFSGRRGTLRGLHYQSPPFGEVKLVRCTRGAVFDVAVDVRSGSSTFGRWVGVELTMDNRRMLYIPPGCAHGYLTLTDNAEIMYFTSEYYRPEVAVGMRFDDPAFGIDWPIPVSVISDRDRAWALIERRTEEVRS